MQKYTHSNVEISNKSDIYEFQTISYFIDENNKCYEINKEELMEGARKIEQISKQDTKEIVESSKQYLINQIKEDGQYEYGRQIKTDKTIEGYNSLRHMGTTWSILEACEITSKQDLEKIKSTIEYGIKNFILYQDENTAYVKDDDEIKLGASGLTILAMLKYNQIANTTEYLELAKKLGNGIIKLQEEDGSYYHILNLDFSKKEKERTTYYDGEATFSLLELYATTQDQQYYNASQKAVEYFIQNGYTQYKDQWLAYTMNRFIQYNHEEKYVNFILNSIAKNEDKTCDPQQMSMIDVEYLMVNYNTYNYIKQNNYATSQLTKFNEQKFLNIIEKRVRIGLASYSYPEIEMYFPVLEKYRETFFEKNTEDYRIRIDNVQHNMAGYILYYKIK